MNKKKQLKMLRKKQERLLKKLIHKNNEKVLQSRGMYGFYDKQWKITEKT